MSAIPPTGTIEPSPEARKASRVATIVFFIIGLSVTLAFDWGAPTPQFRPDGGLVILLGILVGAIIWIAARYTSQADGPFGMRLRFCPKCGRQIRFDATVCTYCSYRLP